MQRDAGKFSWLLSLLLVIVLERRSSWEERHCDRWMFLALNPRQALFFLVNTCIKATISHDQQYDIDGHAHRWRLQIVETQAPKNKESQGLVFGNHRLCTACSGYIRRNRTSKTNGSSVGIYLFCSRKAKDKINHNDQPCEPVREAYGDNGRMSTSTTDWRMTWCCMIFWNFSFGSNMLYRGIGIARGTALEGKRSIYTCWTERNIHVPSRE